MKQLKPRTIADCSFDEPPECLHCEKEMPEHTRVSFDDPYLLAQCVHCGLITPFKLVALVQESPGMSN